MPTPPFSPILSEQEADLTGTETPSPETTSSETSTATKLPRPVFETIFAFPPNRDTLGGTAYLLQTTSGNLLIDCPAWDANSQSFLAERGGVRWLFLTHRGAMGKVKEIQQACQCEIVVQEQEAYLLPNLTVTGFQATYSFDSIAEAIWTCGHSPGSACLYSPEYGGILFTGRHLLPDRQGLPVPLRTSKTFHWLRQIRNIQKLRDRFSPATLSVICPGANTGFLRGQRSIDQAYEKLQQLDLQACLAAQPLL